MNESAVVVSANREGRPERSAPRLTPRELEVVSRLGRGETRASVASSLGITRRTVRTYCSNAEQKYDVSCLADLWRAMGWLAVPV